jgi:hypothetical protein
MTAFNQTVSMTTTSTLHAFKSAQPTVSIATISRWLRKVTINAAMDEEMLTHELLLRVKTVFKTLSQNMTCAPTAAEAWKWGRVILQAIKIGFAQATLPTYHLTHTDVIKLAQVLQRAYPVTLTQAMTCHQAALVAWRLTILQKLRLTPAHIPAINYHLALAQSTLMHDALGRALALALSQAMSVHFTQAKQYVANPVISQALTVHAGLGNTLVLQLVGNIGVDDDQLPLMIYNGDALLDGIMITGLYVNPQGTVTTWAVNTRTNAVTEYTNYNFNSFAQFGLRYLAANSSGIFELDGDTDNGVPIQSDIISAFMQMNGSKLSGLKGVYLAVRGGGQYFIKIIQGDGREYVYQAIGQPGLMTTKVNVGKGLRTRYIAFQLTSTGQDFDLDELTFIPMLSDRRV